MSFTYSSMARCSSRVTPAPTANSAPFTRQAIFACQQYPSVVRGLVLTHARQQLTQADAGRVNISGMFPSLPSARSSRQSVPRRRSQTTGRRTQFQPKRGAAIL